MLQIFQLFCLLSIATFGATQNLAPNDELRKSFYDSCPYMRSKYNPPLLPVPGGNGYYTHIIITHLVLLSLRNLDEMNQMMEITGRIAVSWYMEPCLQWDATALSPSAYNSTFVVYGMDEIWHPAFVLFNSYNSKNSIIEYEL